MHKRHMLREAVLTVVLFFAWAARWTWAAPDPGTVADDVALLKRMSRGFSEVARQAIPAVVFVTVEKSVQVQTRPWAIPDPFRDFFDDPFFQRFFGQPNRPEFMPPRQFRQQGQGSGFLITADGYILTNSHVVDGADKIRVKLHGGREVEARLVGKDPRSDIAVIKIEGNDYPFLPLGDSDAIEVGEWVIAIGNPFGLSESITVGIVSAKGRSGIGLADYEDFIQTDAAINPGNSGGPLLNIEGRVIGINSAIYSASGGNLGIGFAVPINMAVAIYRQILQTGTVIRGYLGVTIQDMTSDLAKSFGLEKEEGILISEVVTNSPADQAGLQSGDVILELDGKKVESVSSFRNTIALTAPGATVTLKIRRDGKDLTRKVTIGKLPDEEVQTAAPAAPDSVAARLGIAVEPLTPQWKERLGLKEERGVVVSRVAPESPAAAFGIREGDVVLSVNRQSVASPKEFMEALERSKKTGRVLLLVKSRTMTRYLVIPIE